MATKKTKKRTHRSWDAATKQKLLAAFEKLGYGEKKPWLKKLGIGYSHLDSWRGGTKTKKRKAA